MDPFRPGRQYWFTVEDGVNKVLHQDRMRIYSVLKGDLDIPNLKRMAPVERNQISPWEESEVVIGIS